MFEKIEALLKETAIELDRFVERLPLSDRALLVLIYKQTLDNEDQLKNLREEVIRLMAPIDDLNAATQKLTQAVIDGNNEIKVLVQKILAGQANGDDAAVEAAATAISAQADQIESAVTEAQSQIPAAAQASAKTTEAPASVDSSAPASTS